MQFYPWYNFELISFLNNFIKPEFNIFEYGGGNSTLYYSQLAKNVCTIETKKEWFDFVISNKTNNNIEIKLCENLPNFSKEIGNFDIKMFDIIIIDSRDRAKCLEDCLAFLKQDGVIILDNSERENLKLPKMKLINTGFNERLFVGVRKDGILSTSSIFFKAQGS
jgi:hypothetical protein